MTISRRDFLKLSALFTASSVLQPALELLPSRLSTNPNAKNVLIILFDTLSASNVNFYGYPRDTMPQLNRLLERATVYHNHYASSNFTTPGTASLLTGRHTWEHLALTLTDTVRDSLANQSIFSLFDDYYKLAYTHNYYADILLTQFQEAITHHEFFKTLFLEYQATGSGPWLSSLMRNDYDTYLLLKSRLTDTSLDGYLYSLLFPSLLGDANYQPPAEISALFPRGVPSADKQDPFILEDGIDWTAQQAASMPQPFLGYFHFLPPHDPYSTREDFADTFLNDGFTPPKKPTHPVIMPKKNLSWEEELRFRQHYDEFILYADSEFHRLFSTLDQQGILENTIVVLTSDHGELIERGERVHNFPLVYEPVIKVPLVIFEPGQTSRRDVHTLSSCIDLLPTLLHYTGHEIPPDLPGHILPPFEGASHNPDREIFSLYARENQGRSHITTASLAYRRGNMKAIRYSNYAQAKNNLDRAEKFNLIPLETNPYYEVFDLEHDPEELNNLAAEPTAEIQALLDKLEQYFRDHVEYPQGLT